MNDADKRTRCGKVESIWKDNNCHKHCTLAFFHFSNEIHLNFNNRIDCVHTHVVPILCTFKQYWESYALLGIMMLLRTNSLRSWHALISVIVYLCDRTLGVCPIPNSQLFVAFGVLYSQLCIRQISEIWHETCCC